MCRGLLQHGQVPWMEHRMDGCPATEATATPLRCITGHATCYMKPSRREPELSISVTRTSDTSTFVETRPAFKKRRKETSPAALASGWQTWGTRLCDNALVQLLQADGLITAMGAVAKLVLYKIGSRALRLIALAQHSLTPHAPSFELDCA